MPLMVSGAAAFVKLMLPLVAFVALDAATVFELFGVVPPAEEVVSVPAELKIAAPDWAMVLPAVRLKLPAVAVPAVSEIVPPEVSDRLPLKVVEPASVIV